MRSIENKSVADLSADQYKAIIDASVMLSAAFGRDIFSITINPTTQDKGLIFGVAFSFNLHESFEERKYGKKGVL